MVAIQNFVKKTEITRIIHEHKPKILHISEQNLGDNIDLEDTTIANYKLEVDQLYKQNKYARSGIYIHNNINYERVKQHELKDFLH